MPRKSWCLYHSLGQDPTRSGPGHLPDLISCHRVLHTWYVSCLVPNTLRVFVFAAPFAYNALLPVISVPHSFPSFNSVLRWYLPQEGIPQPPWIREHPKVLCIPLFCFAFLQTFLTPSLALYLFVCSFFIPISHKQCLIIKNYMLN